GTVSQHYGIDIGAPQGTAVYASASGVVSTASVMNGYGNTIMVSHYVNSKSYTTLYAHLSNMSVSNGQKVSQGEKIGTVGNTGASTGAHLHFEVHRGGYKNRVNPRNYVGPTLIN